MKKTLALFLVTVLVFSLVACDKNNFMNNNIISANFNGKDEADTQKLKVELNVTTTFTGEDQNAQNYKNAIDAWTKKSGNVVVDKSATSDETFKTRVITDFETGSEPDVLFFFSGADANAFIEAGKVVSIDEIRAEYPDYATNMNEELIAESLVDGKKYAVPVNGYWEALFVNKKVLDAAGVSLPGMDYTWEQFLLDCKKIKEAGYVPIACALGNIPHYWWEFAIFNHTGPKTHDQVPKSMEDKGAEDWVAGMEDIKSLYEAGFFPNNTLSTTDDETFNMFTEGKAAFLVDGSWKLGAIVSACLENPDDPSSLNERNLEDFYVTYVPAKNDRKATDVLSGLSMGYYISRKAWNDLDKRAAAVDFVEYMTSDEIVSIFSMLTISALKNPKKVDQSEFNSLEKKAMVMMSNVTSRTAVLQDLFQGDCRVSTFDGMPKIVTGKVSAADAVEEGLKIYNNQ